MKQHEAVFGVSGEQVADIAEFALKVTPWVVGILGLTVGLLGVIGALHPKFKLPPQ